MLWICQEVVFLVHLCPLDAETQCITNPAGNGYRGTTAKTANDMPCISWTAVKDINLVASLSENYISDASNYCRSRANATWPATSCVAQLSDGQQLEQPCKVDFCRTHSWFLIRIFIYGNDFSTTSVEMFKIQYRTLQCLKIEHVQSLGLYTSHDL